MDTFSGRPAHRACSLCHRTTAEAGKMVEGGHGGSVLICRDCAELVIHVLDQEQEKRQAAEADPLA